MNRNLSIKDVKILLFTTNPSLKLRLNDKPQMSGEEEEIKSNCDHYCVIDIMH